MTHKEAVLLSAYTGYLLTKNFTDVHKFVEELLERPINSHEFASEKLFEEIQQKCKPMIIKMVENEVTND